MAGWDDVSTAATEPQQQSSGWDAVSSPIEAPKLPDTSGVQKMAQNNLAAHNDNNADSENKPPQTPIQRLDTATGIPVSTALKGGDAPLNSSWRGHLVDSYKNGTSSNAGDFFQSALHSVMPIVSGVAHPVDTAKKYFDETGNAIVGGGARGVGTLAYPFLSNESSQKLIESGTLGNIPTLTGNKGHDIAAEALTRANALLSPGVGTAFTTMAAPLSPLFSPAIEKLQETAETAGASKDNASLIPESVELGMNLLPFAGARALRSGKASPQFPDNAGPWDNHPGSETARQIIGDALKKPPESVTSSEIDQAIANGFTKNTPTAKDFHDVAEVTGAEVSTLHVIFKETGVKPDQVFEDAKTDPSIAADVSAGKVPEAYEHLTEPKPPMQAEKAGKLEVARDEATRSFNVVDAEGDHVQKGFDSAEEARHYIEDEKFKAEERAAIEEEDKHEVAPTVEKTAQGEQQVIPGAEKITEKALAERKMEGLLKSDKAQKPTDDGLFDVAGRGQGDIFEQKTPPSEASDLKRVEAAKDSVSRHIALIDYLEKFAKRKRTEVPNSLFEQEFKDGDSDRGIARYVEEHKGELPDAIMEALARENVLDMETGETLNAVSDSVRGGHIGQLRRLRDHEASGDTFDAPKSEPVVKTDNPGGEWLETKKRYADEDYTKGRKVSGPVTGYTKTVDFPVSEAVKIKGANGENPVKGTQKFDDLMKSAKKDGFNDESPILIGVNHLGEPYILEGNNRAAVARALGKDTIKAEVKYYSGGELKEGALTPKKLEAMLSKKAETPDAPPRRVWPETDLSGAPESRLPNLTARNELRRFINNLSESDYSHLARNYGDDISGYAFPYVAADTLDAAKVLSSWKAALAEEKGKTSSFTPKPKTVIPPSESGKPTSLRTFLSNNGAKFNEANEIVSMKRGTEKLEGEGAIEYAHELAKENGYLPKDEAGKPSANITELQDVLTEKNGGRDVHREQDADRVAKMREAEESRKRQDPAYIEDQAYKAGIDADKLAGETDKQHIKRITKALQDFYKSERGSGETFRKIIGDTIVAAEKFAGKLTGDLFEKLGDAYIKTFQPELMGDKALRVDAYLAKYKAALQEAQNAFYTQSEGFIRAWDRKSTDERMEWLYDHETGRWNEEENPDHARFQSLLDATHKAEKELGASEAAYKHNYLPHEWEKPDEVKKYFESDAFIKKYGKDGFTKRSTFQLIQDGVRAGFKLKTDNPERMLVSRLEAGDNMVRTMDLLRDMESSGLAKKATAFSIDKKIAKTEKAIFDLQEKYKKELEKSAAEPTKTSRLIEKRLEELKTRLDDFQKEKAENKLTPEQMADVKNGFRVIGPDNKVWNITPEAMPLWKNAMEMKGLWENQGLTGSAYRSYMAQKAIWLSVKLSLSLFHPVHVAAIHLASDISAAADHLIQGGKFSDLALKDTSLKMGLTKNTFKGQDHPAVVAWKTPEAARTPEQQHIVKTMVEGGFKPTMSARDTVHFRENFDKAIAKVGINNLRLLGSVIQLPGKAMAPFFEHWIPGLKSEIYMRRANDALLRDPSLKDDAGRRSEVLRQIAKDTDRTYGEMNQDVQFWNKNVRDAFNAAYISGGWKLAQIYNVRGLMQPANIAYKFAKTGKFSKADITYNMLNAYAYTGVTLALGGAINAMLGNPVGTAKDTVWDIVKNLVFPKTGENNPDGTPIRLSQPAFAKEAYMIARDINEEGLIGGIGSFIYKGTLVPGIRETLGVGRDGLSNLLTGENNPIGKDGLGRHIIENPTDLYEWMNAGYSALMPISIEGYEKAESKGSDIGKVANIAGFPIAGAYIDQTRFEQKVLYTYHEKNPSGGDVYSAELKTELRAAMADEDADSVEEVTEKMKAHGMSDKQIASAGKQYTTKYVDYAWKQLPAQDQKRLIESATEEEKQKFRLKP